MLASSTEVHPLNVLQSICSEVRFAPGDLVRRNGQHYDDMYLLLEGAVDVDLGAKRISVADRWAPIGEMGFLTGHTASATVTAGSDVAALVIDNPTLASLERAQPRLAAELVRYLTKVADQRTSYNLAWEFAGAAAMRADDIEVLLCRSADMLECAQRLRYAVYCQELGRQSPYADHSKRIIADQLDEKGHIFIAIKDGKTVGTLRGNISSEQNLGVYEELYGMKSSYHHPDATAICTKFVVTKAERGGPTAMKLIAAIVRYGRDRIKECYIDCVPPLLPYYRAIGFKPSGPSFIHRENGLSLPMRLDLKKHGERLSRDAGLFDYIRLYLKAKTFKLIGTMGGNPAGRTG